MERVPVIDIRRLPDDAATLARLDEACREWGFFQVVGHDIAPAELAGTHAAMRDFFALPGEEKRRVERTVTNAWGFFDRELTKNRRDWKEIFDVGPAVTEGALTGNVPQWPASLPGFRPTVLSYYEACERLSYRLLAAISVNLGAAPAALFADFGPRHTSFLRLNHYPRCDRPALPESPAMPESGCLGIHPHTDAGALTVLLQDEQPGLQVERGGRWFLVEPRSDALVINIGDIVQVWSNDRYRAAPHRVLANSAADRFSAPFFFNPSVAAVYAPLPSACRGGPPRYRPIPWGEFRAARAAGDYADLGEEIQIGHYRIPCVAA
jgi:isopenicillin N synthase-like dioxygenase